MAAYPNVGDWYRIGGGDIFEVVAFDADDGTIEIQYFDGTVEEMDLEDWQAQAEEDRLEEAPAPEDWTGSIDVEADEGRRSSSDTDTTRRLDASALDRIDRLD
jgi:hypothetical protein